MVTKHVRTSREHIQSLTTASPLQAIEELIWNGLDAGGSSVEVRLLINDMGGLRTIEVADQGAGICSDDIDSTFGELGNSSKPKLKTNMDGRSYHGCEGRGRLKALSLSRQPEWVTTYRRNGTLRRYTIRINRDTPDQFLVSDEELITDAPTGTTVRLENVDEEDCDELLKAGVADKLTQRFALYLSEYPGVDISFEGHRLEVGNLIAQKTDHPLPRELSDHEQTVTIIEWKFKLDSRKLYLCTESGFSIHDLPLRLQTPGIDYTAYFRSPLVRQWAESGLLTTTEMDPGVQKVLDAARDRIRSHIRERLAEDAQDVVAVWKDQDIYPYATDEARNPLIAAEQQVFDVVAVHVNALHPTFKDADVDNKRLTLTLIRKALESNPSTLASLLRKLAELSEEDQEELADLLEDTTLTSLIRAGSVVRQRLDTLAAFEGILFNPDWKARLLERTQLHRLLMHELWILGEEWQVATDDDGLREVLRQHLKILGREELAPVKDVKLIDGRDGIPDVMLWHRGKVDRDTFEHLVVELKRPRDALGVDEVVQTEKYAYTVARNERFKTDKVRWRFVLIGNDFDDYTAQRANGDGLPKGCINSKGNVSVWVYRWADLLADARARYEFFREKLGVQASEEDGMQRLKTDYDHLMAGRGARKKRDLEISSQKAAKKGKGTKGK